MCCNSIPASLAYVSKFVWDDGPKEYVSQITDEYHDWCDENDDLADDLPDPDDPLWYYLPLAERTWFNWESNDGFSRYKDVAAVNVSRPPI